MARVALIVTWRNSIRLRLNVELLADETLEVSVVAEGGPSRTMRTTSWKEAADLVIDYAAGLSAAEPTGSAAG